MAISRAVGEMRRVQVRDSQERPRCATRIPGKDVSICMSSGNRGVVSGDRDGGDRPRLDGYIMSVSRPPARIGTNL